MEEATFVIIGGGIAGVSCSEILNHLCPDEKVILFTASPAVKAVTNVEPLTKMLAKFDVVEKPPEHFLESHPSLKIIHDLVVSINSTEHTIKTKSGLVTKYKKLCVCSGGTPKLISSCNEFVIGIRDTESVQNFQNRIRSARRIVVVGNGGIATEIVYELTGVEIVWVVKDSHISAPFIDPGAAEFFQKKLLTGKKECSDEKPMSKRKIYAISKDGELKGGSGAALGPDWHANFDLQGKLRALKGSKIDIEYKCEIKFVVKRSDCNSNTCEEIGYLDWHASDWPVFVKLTNDKVYGCDFIVSATGVIPNSMFNFDDCKTFDLAEDSGIKVDEFMNTNIKDIFAAGDVCTPNWTYAEHWFQMRLWTQAHQMGCYVAKSMVASLKGEQIFQDFCFELFTHVTKFFGFKVILLGLFNGQKLDGNYNCQLRVTPAVEYIKLVMKNGKMQGAVLIGDTDIEEMCENLILNQLDVTDVENDLLDPDIDIDDYFD